MVKPLSQTKVYGGRLKDREELLASSSGGAFTALSDVFLKQGDAIACSAYNYDTNTQEFHIIENAAQRNAARGSKYVQSIPGNIFKEAEQWLESNPQKKLLFVGVGCQAAGFLKYAETKGFLDRVSVVDIICHGSPSPQLWKDYAQSLAKNKGAITALTFKDKRNGWMHPTPVAVIDGEEHSLREYVRIFYNRKALRPSCHKCPYATTQRQTDITIGDFWNIDEKRPEQYDEMGNSLFLVHTERGQELFDAAKVSLDWFESNTSDCRQPNLEKPTPVADGRERFWADYRERGIDYIIQKYGKDKFINKIKRSLKKLLK